MRERRILLANIRCFGAVTATFGRHDFDGQWRTASDVHAMSLANLDGEFASVLSTEAILTRFASDDA